MSKYRKKTQIVNAIQSNEPTPYVINSEGEREYLEPGDYVITQGKHFSVCQKDEFKKTYRKS